MDEQVKQPLDQTAADDWEASEGAEGSPAVARLNEELAVAKDAMLRLAAEMDNMRKRNATEVDNARKFGAQSLVKEILPVADNLERALAAEGDEKALREGVAMTFGMLAQVLTKQGVTKVDCKFGEMPNPETHQVMQMVASDAPSGSIVQEVQPGYLLNGRLVRPALVTVAQ